MFLHNLKYELLAQLRVKMFIIWLLVFPMALGFFFKMAFYGIYEKMDIFNPIHAAVVMTADDPQLRAVLEGIESSDKPVLKAGEIYDTTTCYKFSGR